MYNGDGVHQNAVKTAGDDCASLVHMYVCMYVYVRMYLHMDVERYIFVCMTVCMYTYTFNQTKPPAYACVCIYICMCTLMYVCIQKHIQIYEMSTCMFR